MRPIDADKLAKILNDLWLSTSPRLNDNKETALERAAMCRGIDDCIKYVHDSPTIGGWISVKDDLPKEHDSIFANNAHLSKYMWAKESDGVIVYVKFPDGTGLSTEGRLLDGKWSTKISQVLEPVVTHWMPMPEAPKGVNTDEAD